MRYVIVGNGPAGINAIEAIRKVDRNNDIINISEEPYLPYSKPVMPHYIGGSVSYEKIFFRSVDFYEEMGVKAILNDRVVAFDPEKKLVVLDSGKRIPYDKLLIATGGKPRPVKIDGSNIEGIFPLTSLNYTKKIIKLLPEVKNALILGGGPLGLKAALALSHHGINVKMIVKSPQIMSQALDPDSAEILEEKLKLSKVELMLKTDVEYFEGDERVKYATLSNGEKLLCDLAIIGKGLLPKLDFLDPKKIRINVGVIVNQYMETSANDVYAAGDVAESYDLLTGGSNTVAVWPRASEQGHFAGMNMAGFKKPYPGAHRMNSLDFEGLSCIVMGDVKTIKEGFVVIIQKDPKRRIYQRIILENGLLRGAAIIGRIVNVGGINKFIRKRIPVSMVKESLLEDKATFIY